MGKSGTALGIIGIILAAGAVGFTFVVWNGQNTTNSDLDDLIDEVNNLIGLSNSTEINNLTRTIGIWNALDDNLDYAPYNLQNDWLFEFGDNKLNNTDYISVSNTNTRITLLKSGWYRIHISVLLGSISPSSNYWLGLLKDGAIESYLDFLATSSTIDSSWHYINSYTFVFSDGTNYIEIEASSTYDTAPSNDDYNQLTIEYVAI